MESLRGKLLIAGAALFDPTFRRAILLVAHHDDEGAMGVILNRPADVTVGQAAPDLAALVGSEEPVFVGGPVQPEAAVVLAEFDEPNKAGVVALGCNIHDQMSAFIVITDSAWTARTNAQGMAAFADAPNASARVTVWHPYLRAPGGQLQQTVAAGQRSASFQVRLRPPPAAMPMTDY